MKIWKLGAVALATLLGVGAASTAPANTLQLERYGRVYALSVCGRISLPGTAHCFAKVVTDARGNIIDGKPNVTRNAVPSGYGPGDLRSAYSLPSSGGAGKTIAIVDAYGYPNAEQDMNTYRAQYGIPACTTANGCFKKVNQNGQQGNYPRTDTGWDQEQALDLDMASAICPDCKILLVQASTSSFTNLMTAVDTAANTPGVVAISNSYGGSEFSSEASYESHYNSPVARGIAVTVSSGDNGYGVEFPAAAHDVTAVGGTSLLKASNARGWTETVWNGAGSGCSAYITKPTWQTDTGCARRTVADVSAIADPNTGVAVYGPVTAKRSGWMVFGGTSVAAPIIGSIYALGSAASPGSEYAHTGSLNDVTSGSNGSCGGTYLCTGVVGYDGPTGNGTPIGTTDF
ncbi:MAG: peptidase S8 [Bacillota bacterium]